MIIIIVIILFEQEKYIFQVKPHMRQADKILKKNILHVNCVTATEGAIESHSVLFVIFSNNFADI